MRMYDIILKKRNGGMFTENEIRFFISGFLSGEIPDYQMSALLMAIWFSGMDAKETALLTREMAVSGEQIDLSSIPGVKVDKHSTGGVGDKTSLIICPIVAACGIPVAKMSGRGLGHTGGTVDKLESIPGFQTSLSQQQFFEIVQRTGLCIIGQTGNIAPADKKLYALRDVTGTIDSLPLIASSIMSKKLAAGSDAILLDVKTGSGAFMKTLEDSVALAQAMVSIGEHEGRKIAAVITDMDRPLGRAIGNSLEVIEAVDTLCGHGPDDLTEICIQLAGNMLFLAQKGTLSECCAMARDAIATGSAFRSLCAMVDAQGGDSSYLLEPARFPKAKVEHTVCAPETGWISSMQTEQCGIASVVLGAGRTTKDSPIEHSAGILLLKKTGDHIEKGEPIAILHTSDEKLAHDAKQILLNAFSVTDTPPAATPLIYARVTPTNVEYHTK